MTDSSSEDSRLKSLAKKLKLDETELDALDAAIFEELGFVRFEGDTEPAVAETSLGVPARFYLPGEDDEDGSGGSVIAVTVDALRPADKETDYKVTILRGGALNGRSSRSRFWTSTSGVGLPHQQGITDADDRAINASIEPLESGGVKISLRQTPLKQGAAKQSTTGM